MRNQDGRKSMFVNLTLCIMGSGRLGGHKPYHRAVINYPLYGQCDLSDENMFNREQIKMEGQTSWNENELEHAEKEKFFVQRRISGLDWNPQDCQPQDWLLVANSEVGNSEYVHYSGLPTPIIHRNSGYNAPQPTLISTW